MSVSTGYTYLHETITEDGLSCAAHATLQLTNLTDIWLMPSHRLHMTTLEVTFAQTPETIVAMVKTMKPALPFITNYTYTHRSRLVKPFLSHDLSAVAVSFLPASGEKVISPPPVAPYDGSIPHPGLNGYNVDAYTYHHLRRDIFDCTRCAGVEIVSRYVTPSAHVTLGRFLGDEDHATPEARRRWIEAIDEINTWLETEIWDQADAEFIGEWVVGQERGLEIRSGPLWYGGGKTVIAGEGF